MRSDAMFGSYLPYSQPNQQLYSNIAGKLSQSDVVHIGIKSQHFASNWSRTVLDISVAVIMFTSYFSTVLLLFQM